MPLEIEQKFRVEDLGVVREQALALGALPNGQVEQCDLYFAHPAKDFRQTGEALRIRRTGNQACITYKGPKLDATIKTRSEIELPLGGSSVKFGALLEVLGFEPVAEVRKRRERFAVTRDAIELEIALDAVNQVGHFVEVEAIAERDQMNPAKAAVVKLAAELGLTRLEPRSYLRMLIENRSA